MNTTTTIIGRTPRTLRIEGRTIEVEELGIPLPFTRKPADLGGLDGGDTCTVYVTETRELTATEFDAFAGCLLASRDWLCGKGGGLGNAFLCVEVVAPGRPRLYINPEGSDYARYVARLG